MPQMYTTGIRALGTGVIIWGTSAMKGMLVTADRQNEAFPWRVLGRFSAKMLTEISGLPAPRLPTTTVNLEAPAQDTIAGAPITTMPQGRRWWGGSKR